MAITPRSPLRRWQAGLRCAWFNEHSARCTHPITEGWWIPVPGWSADPAVLDAYTEEVMPRHRARRVPSQFRVLLWAVSVRRRGLTEKEAWREAWLRGYIFTEPPGLRSEYPPNLEWAVKHATRKTR